MTEATDTITLGAEQFLADLGVAGIPATIIIAVALTLFALFSFKLYKLSLHLIGAALLGYPGYVYLAPILAEKLSMTEPWFNIAVAVGCAIIGAIVMVWLQKFAIFIVGAGIGYFLGGFLNTVVISIIEEPFLAEFPGSLIVPIVAAVIFGIIAKKIFKPLFILGTATLSMMTVSRLLLALIPMEISPIIAIAVGVVLGILCSVFQFKRN